MGSQPAPSVWPGPTAPPPARPAQAGWLDTAPVTSAVIALNVALFLVQLGLSRGGSLMRLPAHEALALGASYPLAVVGENRWETLLTACFLHDGLLHLAFNMLVLSQVGPPVERSVGSVRMAPMYLVAGASGNALTIASSWLQRSSSFVEGASGAISGIVAAGLVAGWRLGGWRGALTQAMFRWLAFIVFVGLVSLVRGGEVANTAHLGGAAAGALVASVWRRGYRYSAASTRLVLGACAAAVAASIGLVALHDRTDRFAAMSLLEREDFTTRALEDGRCADARWGALAVERLRARMAPVPSVANRVRAVCGPGDDPWLPND